ncbi:MULTISPECIES: DinB family protein [unclassified Curtobacterium]|uniref:DinB family protein n=1 Tax=unclassified Curtobacterium TaxID=257496 RepID=UPI000DA7A039|nr:MULTISPECIES: DinB family protein [unclassified Curtobacterium]PZE28735.1 mini-circle protein [Curtobacterium sp. MCBD17_028]WIE53193.1 DinB family protein [Curtobacterium sp. MCBD17_003]
MDDVVVDAVGRPEPPVAADEAATLVGFLEYQRATFAWKTSGLDAAGLTTSVGVSTMTLGGMLKHLALVEDDWFDHVVLGHPDRAPWDAVDWDVDPDWEWRTAADDDPDALRSLWTEAVGRARGAVATALADGGLDRASAVAWPDGRRPSLRWVLCHMIEEYARHNGHADLIREAVDGLVGE